MCGKGISAPADLFAIGIGLYDRVINLTSNDVTLSFQTNKTLRVVRHNAHVHRQAHMSQKCTRSFNIFCTKGAVEKCYLLSRLLSIPFYRPPFLLFHFSFPAPKLFYNCICFHLNVVQCRMNHGCISGIQCKYIMKRCTRAPFICSHFLDSIVPRLSQISGLLFLQSSTRRTSS